MSIEDRFWKFVDKTSDCWNWNGATAKNGYGVFNSGKTTYAHRMAYELSGFKLIDGLVLDHLCRNRRCVNPSHIEQVTRGENARRGIYLGGLCRKGHKKSYSAAGNDSCRECQRVRRAEKRKAKAEGAEN